jgi:hypothetical protein
VSMASRAIVRFRPLACSHVRPRRSFNCCQQAGSPGPPSITK